MTTYIYSNGGLVEKDTGIFHPFDPNGPVAMPRIMRGDDQPPTVSFADGKTYTSKAAMRESYKASNNPQGIDYVEVGDDPSILNPVVKPKTASKADIAIAVEKAEAAVNRGEFDHIK